jgi:hypothetical protein
MKTLTAEVLALWLALRATPYCPFRTQRDCGWLDRHGWIETKSKGYLILLVFVLVLALVIV